MKKPSLCITLCCFMIAQGLFPALLCAQNTKEDRQFRQQLERTLKAHPELILKALRQNDAAFVAAIENAFKNRETQRTLSAFKQGLQKPLHPDTDSTRPFAGKPDAPVTIVAYSDFQCPHCLQGDKALEELLRRHPDTVRILFRHGPFSQTGQMQASYYEALAMQNTRLALQFRDKAFALQGQINSKNAEKRMQELVNSLQGVNKKALEKALSSGKAGRQVEKDYAEMQQFGFRGVPLYLVNGAPIQGSISVELWEKVLRITQGEKAAGQSSNAITADSFGSCLDCEEE